MTRIWTLSNGTELANGGLSISLRDYARFARLYLNEGAYTADRSSQKTGSETVWISVRSTQSPVQITTDTMPSGMGISGGYRKEIRGNSLVIGVYGQFIYVNPTNQVIIVKVNADPDFMSENYGSTCRIFRAIADSLV